MVLHSVLCIFLFGIVQLEASQAGILTQVVNYKSVPQGPGRYQVSTFQVNQQGRAIRWGYPKNYIDGPYLESDYKITGIAGQFYDDVYTFTVYRPSFFTFISPFDVPNGWVVVDAVKLGVTPPPLPNFIPNIKYRGYWYGCPDDLDLYNPLYWEDDLNRFTNFCQYFYYY